MATSSGKVCVRCGLDCSAKQRTKDADGNYICGDCIAQAKARAPAPPPLPGTRAVVQRPTVAAQRPDAGNDQGVLGKLIDESVEMHKHGCPNCHAPMKSSQILCVKCGFNKERGKQIQTVVKKAAQEKGVDDDRAALRRRRMIINNVGPGLSILFGVLSIGGLGVLYLMAINGGVEEKGLFILAQWVFSILVAIIIVIAAFMDDPTTGFTMLLCGLISNVGFVVRTGMVGIGGVLSLIYMLYWVFVESESRLLQSLLIVSFISKLAAVAMIFEIIKGQ